MPKYKVFISSVQSEFANERRRVFDFIRNDELMGQYFEQEADLMKEHGSYPHNPYLAELMYQTGYIEKYGTGITENIRKMQEAHLLAPDIDLSAEFITTIWRDNVATNSPNVATNLGTNIATNDVSNILIDSVNSVNNIATGSSNVATRNSNVATDSPNVATDFLAENKRVVDEIVKKKVHTKMSPQQIKECIIEACIVEHSVEELAILLNKVPAHLRNRFIPELVADGILLPTKPRHSPGQTYMTNPKHSKA